VQVGGSGADYHYRNEVQYFRAIERARAFDRNNMIVGQAINRLTANLVQDGFTPDPQTGDPGARPRPEGRLERLEQRPRPLRLRGREDFHQMELLATRSIPVDGDIFCLPLKSGKLQWLEAHRCRRPRSSKNRNCIHGVTLDPKTAERKSYYFTKEDVEPSATVATLADVIPVDARDGEGEKQVLHLFWPAASASAAASPPSRRSPCPRSTTTTFSLPPGRRAGSALLRDSGAGPGRHGQ
jgi:hypothetical protein